jgi:hypothetical protein
MFALLGLAVAALFTGAAFYINAVEQPARLALNDAAMLRQWKPAYARGYVMQASLAVLGGVLGAASCLVTGSLWAAFGAAFMLVNWPFTLLVIMPVNKKLEALNDESAGQGARALMLQWGKLHSVRTAFGAMATASFLFACLLA